ncbi:MAG TPA: cupin domain-containing protein [Rectinemataceae bacterium]|nr:cupin domain-containing protein [Rectinemataceae bacterium]
MADKPDYKLHMDIKYDYLEKISVPDIVRDCRDKWFNQTLCKVNGSVLRIGIFEGEFHMHKHDHDDEVFFVLEGELTLETEHGNFDLRRFEGVCVPKGVMHRPLSPTKSVVLMIENEGIRPTGD